MVEIPVQGTGFWQLRNPANASEQVLQGPPSPVPLLELLLEEDVCVEEPPVPPPVPPPQAATAIEQNPKVKWTSFIRISS